MMPYDLPPFRLIRALGVLLLFAVASCSRAAAPPTLDDLWAGKAHFQQVGTLDWTKMAGGDPTEQASAISAVGGTWYAFNRVALPPTTMCVVDHWRTVVRSSTDRGRSWSRPVTVAEPGASGRADTCSINDGSAYYDAATTTWHLLAQCLAIHNEGGWQMCHYTRRGASPMGAFTPDANPVVPSGALWKRLCSSPGSVCTASGTHDEGTPDIVGKRGGAFVVTFHGYEPATHHGYRGMATTRDFKTWASGRLLLGPGDCRTLVAGCVGFGETSSLATTKYDYLIGEAMDKDLGCTPGQRWVFTMLRARRDTWPRPGAGWEMLPGQPLLQPTWPEPSTVCQLQYARLWLSGGTTWLAYEDYRPNRHSLARRLMTLVPGGGPPVVKTP